MQEGGSRPQNCWLYAVPQRLGMHKEQSSHNLPQMSSNKVCYSCGCDSLTTLPQSDLVLLSKSSSAVKSWAGLAYFLVCMIQDELLLELLQKCIGEEEKGWINTF